MPDTILESPGPAVAPRPQPADLIRGASVDSRHGWQHLVGLAVDLAFETDVDGRFVFIMPEAPFGWPRGSLIGQSSDLLVGHDAGVDACNPFRPTEDLRRHRTWLRCNDGGLAMITVSVAPLRDDMGAIIGARGIGIDMTTYDVQATQIAGRLRRAEILRHILSCVGHECGGDAMMDAALWALISGLGAEGSAVIGMASEQAPVEVLHECGAGASAILAATARLLAGGTPGASHTTTVDERSLLAFGCQTRFGTKAGLTIWRNAKGRPWDTEDTMLVGSVVNVVRMILDSKAAAREIVHKASTDPLTGLLNRRAFLIDTQRHIARFDRDNEGGTLMCVNLDAFKMVNERLGHGVGDKVLVLLATLLCKLVRPGDLVARLGGDEFAVWLGGADHMTAAERADQFCKTAPVELQASLPEPLTALGVSIGIATRRAGSQELIEDLIRRADKAMDEVKRGGGRQWRVSLPAGD